MPGSRTLDELPKLSGLLSGDIFHVRRGGTDYSLSGKFISGGSTGYLVNYATVSFVNGISGYLQNEININIGGGTTINFQTGSYNLQTGDNGNVVDFSGSSRMVCGLPNSFSGGYNTLIIQSYSGQVILSGISGATYDSRNSYSGTAGRWAELSLLVRHNPTSSGAFYIVAGDGA